MNSWLDPGYIHSLLFNSLISSTSYEYQVTSYKMTTCQQQHDNDKLSILHEEEDEEGVWSDIFSFTFQPSYDPQNNDKFLIDFQNQKK